MRNAVTMGQGLVGAVREWHSGLAQMPVGD